MDHTISAIMATYNGDKFIRAQIESILEQIGKNDELIISDDGSNDNTCEIIQEYAQKYDNVFVFDGPHKGYIENFQFLLSKTKNDLVMISDQDDIWEKNKVEKIKKVFDSNRDIWVVIHDASFINKSGVKLEGTIFRERNAKSGFLNNLIKSMYYGCCMTLSREYVDFILPFPYTVAAYDQWIGLYAEYKKKVFVLNESLIKHRLHDNNQSIKRSMIYRIWFRYIMLKYVISLEHRKTGIKVQ